MTAALLFVLSAGASLLASEVFNRRAPRVAMALRGWAFIVVVGIAAAVRRAAS
jgi:hypothetical protein